ncbi:MAG: 5-3 exonuclease [Gaiellales bacterium]|nr:5-3 exonuclease [Gaiellales bacterium]
MVVHLVDGTYELFRQFYGRQRGGTVDDKPFGAVIGVLHSVLEMIETGATHIGVATDHVIESFRNGLWPGYKTGLGVDPALRAQFEPLEVALAAMGVTVWAMVELEADDALAAAARAAEEDPRVDQVRIWTPDKDLAQCVREHRVVQVDRRAKAVRDESGVREKFGVEPRQIPDFLALVGDSADGYPGIPGIGKVGAARLVTRHGAIEAFPPEALGDNLDLALLFKDLATLRAETELFADVDELRWQGPTPAFAATAEQLADRRLVARCLAAQRG